MTDCKVTNVPLEWVKNKQILDFPKGLDLDLTNIQFLISKTDL